MLLVIWVDRCCSLSPEDERTESVPPDRVESDIDGDRTKLNLPDTNSTVYAPKNGRDKSWKSDSIKYTKRVAAARRRWKKTFQEIKTIAVDISPESQKGKKEGNKLFDQWKLLLDGDTDNDNFVMKDTNATEILESAKLILNGVNQTDSDTSSNDARRRSRRQRFDGFATWETLLQKSSDDAKDSVATQKKEGLSEGNQGILMGSKNDEMIKGKDTLGKGMSFLPRPVKEGESIVPHTDIGDKSKKIWIVTTAALPWMTGTAVNPLLRASYMTNGRTDAGGKVTLMLPWLELVEDRDKIYGKDRLFDSPDEQEDCIRKWLREEAGLNQASNDLQIAWYIGRHETQENSIYSMGDITALIPEEEVDICVLEEPEHLNWYRAPGDSWTKKFKHVVGIVHTNYFVYAQEQPAALIRAPGMRLLSSWMCRAHCHRIIKLSGTLDKFAPEKELVENVHGVRGPFLDYGRNLAKELKSESGGSHLVFGPEADPKVYFIGKMLWSKGIGSLMELLKYAQESADLKIDFDMFGGGPNFEEAKTRSQKFGLSMEFHGPIDHAALADSHKIFVNPSLSEVLCTTVAEALAMGKFCVVPSHPSNDFFAQFPNCLTYANKEEFVGNLYYALTHSPEPLSVECAYALSWDAANERFANAGSISVNESEEFSKILSSEVFEIGLPPLIEDEKRRKRVSRTMKNTRQRYREFRSNLADEIRSSEVLPYDLKQGMLYELEKRLDIDVDELLTSPKLKFQLSPAELDRQLLDLYNTVIKNPGADMLRTVLGGANVGRQSYYLKQEATKARKKELLEEKGMNSRKPEFLEDVGVGGGKTATARIKRTLRRNLLQSPTFLPEMKLPVHQKSVGSQQKNSDTSTMLYSIAHNPTQAAPVNFHSKPNLLRLSSRIPSLLI